ncbi:MULTISPECIES: hypothetical protein [unclassified Streptomyces]|uniref:hypothetical protein n=1 Tax=unclassified Streptomyces TaxID=2593676 RepID=UPI00344BC8EE
MGRRWVPALVLGGLWWWAVLRLVLQPEQAGVVEGAVAAGGWGLSLLPVHVAPAVPGGAEEPAERAGPTERAARAGSGRLAARLTRAWRRRRSGGGSGRW